MSESQQINIHEADRDREPNVRQVYLITYSQADLTRFPTRRAFADRVINSFDGCPATIKQRCCCLEQHTNNGWHYHMAVKFDRPQRWIRSKRRLLEEGVSHSAWSYVNKEDQDALHSLGHPDLRGPPRTHQASSTVHSRRRLSQMEDDCSDDDVTTSQIGPRKKKKRLSAFELSEIIVQKGIKTRLQLLVLADEQKKEGKTDVAEFIVNRGSRIVSEVLNTAWEMKQSRETLERRSKTRLELLYEAKDGDCELGCNGQWLECALQLLNNNVIDVSKFQQSVGLLLDKGRGKYRNIMIIGPCDTGKTFILNPLTRIYNTFSNPASSTFAWVGADEAECIFLNDFRSSSTLIQWHDFLLMLEGQPVHLPAPKSHYAKDLVLEEDTPIFATGKRPLVYMKNGVVDERETDMMSVRWIIFNFNAQVPREAQKELLPCGKCFASLILGC